MIAAATPQAAASGSDGQRPILRGFGIFLTCGAACLSTTLGYNYWRQQGEEVIACFAIIFEGVALITLPFMADAWSRGRRLTAAAALVLLIGAEGFCGFTNWQNFSQSAAYRARAALEQSASYRGALAALSTASANLSARAAAHAPECRCPATIASWTSLQERELARLAAERDRAQARLDALQPGDATNLEANFSWMIELLKLFGFYIFTPGRSQNPTYTPGRGKGLWRGLALPFATRAWRWAANGVIALLGLAMVGQPTIRGTDATQAANTQGAAAQDVRGGAPGGSVTRGSSSAGSARSKAAAPPRPPASRARRAERIAQVRALAAAGVPKTKIAQAVGVCRATVYNYLRS